jgi:SAM-dependent methyltransferase
MMTQPEDVRFLPFAAASFSVVTTSFMLLHLTHEEKRRVFAETRRALEAGGRFGLLTGREETTGAYPSPGEWRAWLEEAGFAGVVVSEWGDA